ncbi:MAG: glycosyltransferase [Acidimicrobiales bacterium]|nr:glycosyltransferase [Acidimicrobiales bacterium]
MNSTSASAGGERTSRHGAAEGRVISVVVATYNRAELLAVLLEDLASQAIPPGWSLEVVVTDDGSAVPVAPRFQGHHLGDRLVVLSQRNAGPAAARHHAIEHCRGEILLCLDDDMRVAPDFIAAHLRHHAAGAEVVLGRIDDARDGVVRPLFHRLHQKFLDAKVGGGSGEPARGIELFTGNVSFTAERYREVGGFDVTLRRCEDRDLGIRFEQAGARIVSAPDAPARHFSDHEDVAGWRRRTREWGALDQAIAERRGASAPSPWQVLRQLPGPFTPVAVAAALAPGAFGPVAGAAYRSGELLARLGLEGPALQAAAVTYGIDYFRGVGGRAPHRRAVLRAARGARRAGVDRGSSSAAPEESVGSIAAASPPRGPWASFVHAVQADHACSRHYRARYQGADSGAWRLPLDAVTKIGFQMLIAVRAMRLLRDLRIPFGAQLASRAIRHLYGAEIHWDAELAPGLAIVHGNGLVISADARVGQRCILFQHVTLGRSLDAATGVHGAPTLREGVHVGPGAVLLGPIEIGERAKIVANSVITADIPAGMVARPAPVELVPTRLQAVDGVRRDAAANAGGQPAAAGGSLPAVGGEVRS